MIPQGKVVKIVDKYSVVVDIGSVDGVSEDMDFVIYETGEEIEDPETGESLGELEHPKARVKPHHIQANMTVMETAETEIRTYEGPANIPNPFRKRKKKVRKPLPLEEAPETEESDNNIQVGDLVREYHPDSDERSLYGGSSE